MWDWSTTVELDLREAIHKRTVGWMVHHFPHMVRMKRDEKSFKVVETVKRLRASIPNEGVGFGLLRSMSKNGSIREKMSKIAIPRLGFVYRSGLDDTFRSNVSFPIIKHSVYKPKPLGKRQSPLTLFAGKNREGIGWLFAYTPNAAPKEKVDFMSQSIKEFLLRLC